MNRTEIHLKEKEQDPMDCILRLPLPNADSAQIIMQVLRAEPPIAGTSKEVELWADDSTRCTVYVRLDASHERALRSAVGGILEQIKLILRTMDAFPIMPRSSNA